MSTPTQITIYPDRQLPGAAFPSSGKKLAGTGYDGFARAEAADKAGDSASPMFGKDGFGLKDVVDIINPLQHIPFVSSLYQQLTGDTVSPGAKLIGGALLGGPLGFMASLADVIFEQETGKSAGGAAIAALTGEETAATTQVADASEHLKAAAPSEEETASAAPVAPVASKDAETYAMIGTKAQMQLASAISNPSAITSVATPDQLSADKDTLALFGADVKSAHASYRKAQFTPYLKDVSTSLVM